MTQSNHDSQPNASRTYLHISEHHWVCLAFLTLGLGHLVSWMSIVAAADYWAYIYRSDHEVRKDSIEFSLSAVYHSVIFAAMLLSTVYVIVARKQLVVTSVSTLKESVSLISICLTVMLTCMALILLLCHLYFHWLLLLFTAVIATAEGILRCEIYSLTAKVKSQDYTTGLMIGHCVAGLMTCFLRISTKLAFTELVKQDLVDESESEQTWDSVVLYFGLAMGILVACIATIQILGRSKQLQEDLGVHDSEQSEHATDDWQVNIHRSLHSANGNEKQPLLAKYQSAESDTQQQIPLKELLHMLQGPLVGVAISFFTTMTVFPGLFASLPSIQHYTEVGWFALILITMFNASDFCGRMLLFVPQLHVKTSKQLNTFIILRATVLIPIIIVHTFAKRSDHLSHTWFAHDVMSGAIVVAFGISNGYLGTSALVQGAVEVRHQLKEQRQSTDNQLHNNNLSDKAQQRQQYDDNAVAQALTLVGRLMSLSLVTGTVLGSWLGIGIDYAINRVE